MHTFPRSALRLPKINLRATSQQCVAYHLPADANDRFCSVNLIDRRLGPARLCGPANYQAIPSVVFCSCATKKPAGQGRHLRIARVAHKPCASLERRDGSTVYPICTYLNAEGARCPVPRKARRQAKRNSRRKLVPGISTSSATQHARSKDATSY
jgi:hypothetical protein